ncbi:hypothetical protein [Mobiluncus mulieris]|uniref:hypothetical protein n=1 Tax=Mobiluncus mulieris TaxID=2052 RepID=UPI0020160F10|nr:hypothetical protein [Mobiluncus mulieris]
MDSTAHTALIKPGISTKSSSLANENGIQVDSTGEETPQAGESRCEHCGKPNQAEAALTAAEPAPHEPQPTVPTTEQGAAA